MSVLICHLKFARVIAADLTPSALYIPLGSIRSTDWLLIVARQLLPTPQPLVCVAARRHWSIVTLRTCVVGISQSTACCFATAVGPYTDF